MDIRFKRDDTTRVDVSHGSRASKTEEHSAVPWMLLLLHK